MDKPLVIQLGWPAKELSPNHRSRSHWPKTNAKAKALDESFWTTRQAMGATLGPQVTKLEHDGVADVVLRQVAHPPDRRERDKDNVYDSLKAHRDGIAKAIGINDKYFKPLAVEWAEPLPGGRIVITIGGKA